MSTEEDIMEKFLLLMHDRFFFDDLFQYMNFKHLLKTIWMHEIVTLQFGQRANYLATHFWNLQESYFTYAPNTEPSTVDHDVHFRPGIGTDGSDTYTPRTLIYDLKGGFGSMKKTNALYDDIGNSRVEGLWSNGTVMQTQDPIPQTQYQQNLDLGLPTGQIKASEVRYWSDFNRVFFHPRSIVQLNEYSLGSSLMPFESWNVGEELFREVDRESDLLDRDVRSFTEEADQMQAIQIFTSADDAWGGWTEQYVNALQDEYGKKSIWVWALEDGKRIERAKAQTRAANSAKSLNGIAKIANAMIRISTQPRSLPGYINLGTGSEWERTALMAAAMESVTLPTRLRAGTGVRQSSIPHFEQTLNTNEGQNIFDLGLSVPKEDSNFSNGNGQGLRGQGHAEDTSDDDSGLHFDLNMTPSLTGLLPQTPGSNKPHTTKKHTFAQIETDRFPYQFSDRHVVPQALDREEQLRRIYDGETVVEKFNVPLGFPHLDTFPVGLFTTSTATASNPERSVISGLTTSSSVKQNIFELRDIVTRQSRVISVDEREDLYNGLTEIGDKYTHGYESDDDEEDA